MQNKLPKFFDNHKICIICEGNEEYEYLNRLKNLKVWNEQYDISLVNAGGNGNIPARYQDRYQNGADELVLVFCDTEKKPHEQYEDIKRKYLFCVGVPQSFIYLKNVILENVRTAESMMIAYESYQRGITNKVDLIAYSHGEEGKNEYSRNRKRYRTI